MKRFLGITGTTCVGKSEVAVLVAKKLGCEIISADSQQVYKGMDIGTAKISAQETQGVKHHLLDVVLPNQDFSAFEFQQRASEIIRQCAVPPVVVGGTGLYFDCLVYPPEFGSGYKSRRVELNGILKEKGLSFLCEILKQLDPETYSTIDLKNPVRVVRAIEIAESGQKRSEGKGKSDPQFDAEIFVLQRDRQQLYKMIDERVDTMLQKGLVKEVQSLVSTYGVCDTSAFSAIGYKEIIQFLQGKCTLEEAVAAIKLNTRHYAKRQITYFKRMKIEKFIDVDGLTSAQIADEICTIYAK